MQTYTHAIVGLALGVTFFRNNPVAQLACAATAMVPDLVMVPQFINDRLAGREPLKIQSKFLLFLKEVGHSLVVWAALAALVLWFVPPELKAIGLAITLGGFSHGFIDVFTHGSGPKETRPYWDTDLTFVWPLPFDLRPCGIWEYRHTPPDLVPKLFEMIVILALIAYIANRLS